MSPNVKQITKLDTSNFVQQLKILNAILLANHSTKQFIPKNALHLTRNLVMMLAMDITRKRSAPVTLFTR